MSGTQVQHTRQLQVSIEPELTEIGNSSVEAVKSMVNTDIPLEDKFAEARTVSPGLEAADVSKAAEYRSDSGSFNEEDLLSEHKVLLIQKEEPEILTSTPGTQIICEALQDGWLLIRLALPAVDLVQTRPPAEKQSPSQTPAKKAPKSEKKATRSSIVLEAPSIGSPSDGDKPKTKKARTVQFAEGTTLPIIDVTPKTPKASGSGTGKSPMQCLTDTMQVIKRYETDLRAQEITSQRFEQKRIMLTIERMFTVVMLVQGGITLALLAVLLAVLTKA